MMLSASRLARHPPHDITDHRSDAEQQHFPTFADRARASTRNAMKNGLASPTHSAHANFFRASILQVTPEKKARKVRFYRNGDRFFNGMLYAVPQEKYRTLESLMAELTASPICDPTVLPRGVRYMFALDGSRITALDQVEDGEYYVCSSTHTFQKVDYPVSSMPWWNVNPQTTDQMDRSLTRPESSGAGSSSTSSDERDYIKPKLITIIRNGSRPRKATRILLNKKTAHSFDQVLTEITDAIKLDTGAVKKVYTMAGRQVLSLQDFFTDDDIFFAYGPEKTTMDDFDLSRNEIQFVSAYSRSARQQQIVTLKSPRTARRVVLSSNSSSNKSLQENDNLGRNGMNGQKCSDMGVLSKVRPRPSPPQSPRKGKKFSSKSPVLSRAKRSNGSPAPNGHSDDNQNGPSALREKYKVGNTIGEGNYAVVKECLDKAQKVQFALKIINKTKCLGRVDTIENEVSILRRIKHSNIVQLIEEFDTPDTLYLIMELVTGGDLFDSISAATKYTEKDASGMLCNLAKAINYLHSQSIVHRDIKPENILVHTETNGCKILKLGDFGLAKVVDEPLLTVCGTPTYVAPEVLAETGYGLKVDIWSIGVVTHILLCGFAPFTSEDNSCDELFEKIMAGTFEFISPYWDDISTSAKELIRNLLEVDEDKRFSSAQLLSHPWVMDDIARDEDIHATVSNNIVEMAKSNKKPKTNQPGVAVITTTALDKGSRYFEGRKHLKCVLGGDEVF